MATLVQIELEILMTINRLSEAWAVVRRHSVPDHLLLRLAKVSEDTLPGGLDACGFGIANHRHVARADASIFLRLGSNLR